MPLQELLCSFVLEFWHAINESMCLAWLVVGWMDGQVIDAKEVVQSVLAWHWHLLHF